MLYYNCPLHWDHFLSTEERFEVVILGPSQVEIEEGASQFLVCETNQNASSITWTFNGIPIQVRTIQEMCTPIIFCFWYAIGSK